MRLERNWLERPSVFKESRQGIAAGFGFCMLLLNYCSRATEFAWSWQAAGASDRRITRSPSRR